MHWGGSEIAAALAVFLVGSLVVAAIGAELRQRIDEAFGAQMRHQFPEGRR